MELTETSEVTLSNVIYSGNFLFLFNTSLGVLFNAHKSLKLLAFTQWVTLKFSELSCSYVLGTKECNFWFQYFCFRNKLFQGCQCTFLWFSD